MLTNKELSEKLNIPITKIRRNTKELLGEDPVAKRRTGFMRQFTINEGFFVYLGGFLVSHLGMSFEGARNTLEILKPWLLLNGLVPAIPKNSIRLGADRKIKGAVRMSLLPSPNDDRIQLFIISGVADSKPSSDIDSLGRSFSISENITIEYQISSDEDCDVILLRDPLSGKTVSMRGIPQLIDPLSEETIFTREIPIMDLIENFTRLVTEETAFDWFLNWRALAEKDPTEAENSIKKFVKEHEKYPSLSELLAIMDIQMD
jgi:hypothetical protein